MSPEVLVQKMNWGWDSNTLSPTGSRQIEAKVGVSGWGYPKRLFLEMDGGTCILLEWDVRISCGCDSHCGKLYGSHLDLSVCNALNIYML